MDFLETFIGVLLFTVVVPALAFAAVLGLFALLGSGLGAAAGLAAVFNFLLNPAGQDKSWPRKK